MEALLDNPEHFKPKGLIQTPYVTRHTNSTVHPNGRIGYYPNQYSTPVASEPSRMQGVTYGK